MAEPQVAKARKKLAREQAAAEYAAKIDRATKDLTAILNDETSWTLEEKETRLATIKEWNLQDENVSELIDQVEDKLSRERAEANRMAEKKDYEKKKKPARREKQRNMVASRVSF